MIKITNEWYDWDDTLFNAKETDNKAWKIRIPKKALLGATLLSREEAEKYMTKKERESNCSWWLRDSLEGGKAGIVYPQGDFGAMYVTSQEFVKPALQLSRIELSDTFDYKFDFGGYTFSVASENLAICDDFTACRVFNQERGLNDYNESAIKRGIDGWFRRSLEKYEER